MTRLRELPTRGKTNNHCTPPEILNALGRFTMDPCACNPQPFDTADLMIHPPCCGLTEYDWQGRIWLNPPYGAETARWVERLADHGNGIALVFVRSCAKWFHKQVFQRADALLFLQGRVQFYTPEGVRQGNAAAPSVLIAYGVENANCLRSCGLADSLSN